MAIEIKELIIRAVVDTKSVQQPQRQGNEKEEDLVSYLEDMVKGLQNKNER